MRTASWPAYHETGQLPPQSGFGTYCMRIVPDDVRERADRTAAKHLDWLGHVMGSAVTCQEQFSPHSWYGT